MGKNLADPELTSRERGRRVGPIRRVKCGAAGFINPNTHLETLCWRGIKKNPRDQKKEKCIGKQKNQIINKTVRFSGNNEHSTHHPLTQTTRTRARTHTHICAGKCAQADNKEGHQLFKKNTRVDAPLFTKADERYAAARVGLG